MRHIGRRELLDGGVAALTAGVAVLPAAAAIEPHSQLAELMEEYRSAERSWGAIYDDKQADKYYAAHVRPMYRVIGGTPARTQQDALAAIDYLIAKPFIAVSRQSTLVHRSLLEYPKMQDALARR